MTTQAVKTMKFKFGEYHLFPRYCIAEPGPYQDIDREKADRVIELLSDFYDQPFGYIANRLHGNSIDPMNYKRAADRLNFLKAFAIVAYNNATLTTFKIEQQFVEGFAFDIFTNLQSAVDWTLQQVETAS